MADTRFAFPLLSGDRVVGVVSGRLSDRIDADRIDLRRRVRDLIRRLGPELVRLDTAMRTGLLSSVRPQA